MPFYKKFSENRMQSKQDFQQVVLDLFEPLIPYFENQGAEIDFEEGAAWFDMKASYLEGVARPLWGIIPLVFGGGEFAHWNLIRSAIIAGTDPENPQFWGNTSDIDQRSVEMAALGLLLALLPEYGWDPLTQKQQDNFARFLAGIQFPKMPQNNWLFFTILVQDGLIRVNQQHLVDYEIRERNLALLRDWYLGDGWYGDGVAKTIDHYGGYAMHLYGLLYAHINNHSSDEYASVFTDRAYSFAKPFSYWFADDGDSLAVGRSLTYRFAAAGYWGMLAVSGLKPMPTGQIKRLWAQQIRSWRNKPIFTSNGLLSRGYHYPNLLMCEDYNSPTSPYWAFKAFFPLMLPDDSEFWTCEEEPVPYEHKVYPMPASQSIAQRVDGHSVVHYGAPIHEWMQLDKYNKFAYSTRFGMDINSLLYANNDSFGDNILAFSFDGGANWQMRNRNTKVTTEKDQIYIHWLSGTQKVQTEITVLENGSCMRKHTFDLAREALVVETGFAVDQWYSDAVVCTDENSIKG